MILDDRCVLTELSHLLYKGSYCVKLLLVDKGFSVGFGDFDERTRKKIFDEVFIV